MNIGQLGNTQFSALVAALKGRRAAETSGQNVPSSENNCAGTISAEGQRKLNTARELMSRYDVRNISYNDLTILGRELYEQGVISFEENAFLTAPGLNNIIQGPGVDPTELERRRNTPYDVLALNETHLASAKVIDPNNVVVFEHLAALLRDLELFQPRR